MAYQISQYAATLDRQLASSSPAPSIARTGDLPRSMNHGLQLGVIDLKTCLQAVLKASPEIYSEDTDYTVYAFDPSEHGSPRVGHGRLSQIINSSESSEEDQVMVTGMVKNNLALLATSQQVQDNLEVRLALTPVQSRVQVDTGSRSPFLQERAPSPLVTGYPDMNNLINFNRMDPQFLKFLQSAASSQGSAAGSDALQRFMTSSSNDHRDSRPTTSSNFSSFQQQAHTSRPTSPALSIASNTSAASRRPLKRTASTVSRSNMPELPSSLSQVDAGYISGEDNTGPKRVRATTVERPGKNVLNKKGDLRVVASTAASLRVYQPTAVRPLGHQSQTLEEPPRVPTPVPQGNNFPQRRTSTVRSSLGLRTETSFSHDSRSPFSESNFPSLPNSAVTSPEGMYNQAGSPEELGSSPPVIPGMEGCPSSPALPPLPIHDDSGFMSGGLLNDMSEMENDDNEDRASMQPPPKKQRFDNIVFKEPQVLRNSTANIQPHNQISASRARSAAGLKKATPPPSSDIILDSEVNKKQRGRPSRFTDDKKSSWDKEKRRQAMVAKLHNSVANGEIPPFCHNCGVIETPTWRRAFTKIHSGDPPVLVIPKGGVKEDGAIIGCEVIQQDPETGKSELFRIYKKSLLSSDEAFEAISLCNQKLWNKSTENDDSRNHDVPERERRPRLARGDEEAQSEATETTTTVPSKAGMGSAELNRQPSATAGLPAAVRVESGDSQPDSRQASTVENKEANTANTVKSGSQPGSSKSMSGNRRSPIELDKSDPSPVRRSLFSSPRSSGPLGVDIQSKDASGEGSSMLFDVDDGGCTPLAENIGANTNKATGPSTPSKRALGLPPVTPMSKSSTKDASFSRSPSNLFKTPSPSNTGGGGGGGGGTSNNHRVTTSDFFSSSAKKLLHGAAIPHMTPSKRSGPSPAAEEDRFSPQLPRLLRTIYGDASPENEDFSDIFDVNMGHLFEGCPKRPEDDFRSDFPGTEEDWAAADAFFNSSGITGFTPRKPLGATEAPDEDTAKEVR